MKKNSAPFLIVALLSLAHTALAADASLSITPPSGVYPIGEQFVVEVRIDSGGEDVGSSDMTVVYDTADVEYVGVSDEGSIFSTILVDSTTNPGRIDLSGFIARGEQAYSGTDGLVARLTFLPLRNAATELRFANAAATPPLSLTASVGDLTNILTDLHAATYTLVPRESVAAPVAAVAYAQEGTHFEITPIPVPDSEWFGTTTIKLSWSLPDGVGEMRTGVSTDQDATPDDVYPIPVNSVNLDDLEEGKQYFLLQFMKDSSWGAVIRYPLQLDLTAPSKIVVQQTATTDESDKRTAFAIEASDELSGISHYEIGVDGEEAARWDPPSSGIYVPNDLSAGEHVLTVTAFDNAGNSTSTDLVFLVRSLDPPVLTDAPDHALAGDTITVRGTTYPNADVTVFTSYDDGEAREHTVTSDDAGIFIATLTDGARAGKYTVWFKVVDARGVESPISIKRSVPVKQPYIMLFGKVAVTYLSVIIPLVGLILLLGLILWLGYTYVRDYRLKIGRETNEAYGIVHSEFEALRKDLIKQIGMLEKANQSRELTREEMKIFTTLSKRLDHMERHIQDEIDDIDKVEEQEAQQAVLTKRVHATAAAPKKHTLRIERV